MDFIEGLTNLSSVIAKRKDIIETEEAVMTLWIIGCLLTGNGVLLIYQQTM